MSKDNYSHPCKMNPVKIPTDFSLEANSKEPDHFLEEGDDLGYYLNQDFLIIKESISEEVENSKKEEEEVKDFVCGLGAHYESEICDKKPEEGELLSFAFDISSIEQ